MDYIRFIGIVSAEAILVAIILVYVEFDWLINCKRRLIEALLLLGFIGINFVIIKYGDKEGMRYFSVGLMVVIIFIIVGEINNKKGIIKKTEVIHIPGGCYEGITYDGNTSSSINLQSQIRYDGKIYMIAGGLPDKESSLKLYVQETEEENVYFATVMVDWKTCKKTKKQIMITLHNWSGVINLLLIPIFAGSGSQEMMDMSEKFLVLALGGIFAFMFRSTKDLLFRLLYYMFGFMELLVWFYIVLNIVVYITTGEVIGK